MAAGLGKTGSHLQSSSYIVDSVVARQSTIQILEGLKELGVEDASSEKKREEACTLRESAMAIQTKKNEIVRITVSSQSN